MTRITLFTLLQTHRLVELRLRESALLEAALLITPPTPSARDGARLGRGEGTRQWLTLGQCWLFNPLISPQTPGLPLLEPHLSTKQDGREPLTRGPQVGSAESPGLLTGYGLARGPTCRST